ncbi:hypothetical protein P3B99_002445 [Opitutia bacterium KCR 482]|nr:hypothetical protein [Opitutae bacterium KCR 482]
MKKIPAILVSLAAAFSAFGGDSSPKFFSGVDADWANWKNQAYNYGFDKTKVPVPIYFDSSIMTNSTIMVRGNDNFKKRWGLHVFEAYARDDRSRITMILNKHVEEGLPVAELYYYAAAYGQGFSAYNWFRVGSDVPYHSFMFGRDKAIFYGEVDMRNLFVLDNIGRADLLDKMPPAADWKAEAEKLHPREKFETDRDCEHARMGVMYQYELKMLKKKALKNAKNGAMFYDKDNDIVVVKVGGKWRKVVTEDLPAGVSYDE